MGRTIVSTILIFSAVAALFAVDWPLESVIVTSTFGEHRGDHFHTGIDLGGGEQPVYPISAGELVFSYEEGSEYSSLPVGLGNFLVLQHQGGVRSLYAHLKEGSIEAGRRNYDRSQPLGLVGSSGYSSGKHLHLAIIDSEMGTIINPLILLPPQPDAQPPVIREVYIRNGQGLIKLADGMVVRRGPVEISAEIYDLRSDVSFLWKLAPYRVSVYQEGREVVSFMFDSLHTRRRSREHPSKSEQELVLVNSELAFEAVYASEWLFRLGEVTLIPGETTLTVFASDFAGNEGSKEYGLVVQE